ncbi:MAG: ChbG/HpnK family deacetylase [Erysipelotrichaceae bacterium]|nr:ChbG/HpnK family deacetylase [Erysipelotrichaceae bacterium]
MKLLVQSDDYGFTDAVTYGVIDGMDRGIIRNTGIFMNMPSAKKACELMKGREHCCFGIDFNIVAGPSVCNPKEVPHLVDENGEFIKSGVRIKDPRWQTEEGRRQMFPYEEVYKELKAQYDLFVEYTGMKPGYLHGHSITHESYNEAMERISEESGVHTSTFFTEKFNIQAPIMQMFTDKNSVSQNKTFFAEGQLNKDTLGWLKEHHEEYEQLEYGWLIGHMGYCDAKLLKYTSLSLERMKDLEMAMDPWTVQWVKDNNIELITYHDLQKELKKEA